MKPPEREQNGRNREMVATNRKEKNPRELRAHKRLIFFKCKKESKKRIKGGWKREIVQLPHQKKEKKRQKGNEEKTLESDRKRVKKVV